MGARIETPTFFTDCGGPFDLTPDHTITNGESLPTSGAEVAVIAFLQLEPQRLVGKRLLHIGIGNCSLPALFAADLSQYVGITISLPEIALFESKLAGVKSTTAILMNKYDPRMYGSIRGEFDFIIDTLLKSYACCEKHFEQMMAFFTSKLRPGGALITTETGVLWGWRGNTRRSYTPGAQTDPAIAKFRVLGRDGLSGFADRLGLIMTVAEVPNPQGDPALNDSILILTRR